MNNFLLPKNYKVNIKPLYFLDKNDRNRIYQPHVYELARFFAQKKEINYLIDIGCGNGEKLINFPKQTKIIGIDFGENLKTFKKNIPNAKIIKANLEKKFPVINKEILKSSIIICSDVLEHLVNPSILLKKLSEFSYIAPLILISTPDRDRVYSSKNLGPPKNPSHVREWALDELSALFTKYKFNYFLRGYTINNSVDKKKSTQLFISGNLINPNVKTKKLKILAIMSCYDEEDIIKDSVLHLLKQNIDVFAIDNWSKDKTYSILLNIKKKYPHNLFLKRYPNKTNKYYQWSKILELKQSIAQKMDYDWYLHYDADEIRLSCWENVSLKKGIEIVDALGFNTIDFTTLEMKFCLPSSKNKYYDFGKRPGHFIQLKAWKKNKKIDLVSSGGHEIIFPNRKIFPLKFLLLHYSLRSTSQFFSKLADRISRYHPDELKKNWHTHYFNSTLKDLLGKEEVKTFTQDFYSDFLVERLSGIGIINDSLKQPDLNKKEVINEDLAVLTKRIKSLEDENNLLKSSLYKIQSSKTYKLWQGYCKIRDKILRKLGIRDEK